MKKTLLAILMTTSALTTNFAVAATETESKVKLLVYPADTLDDRWRRQQTKVNLPPPTKPYTDADLSKLNGDALASAMRENAYAMSRWYEQQNRVAWQEYFDAKKKAEELMQKKLNTNFGRLIGNVSDWLAGSLGKYPEIIRVITRTDMDEGATEQNLSKGGGDLVLALGTYKVKPAISDLDEYQETLQLPGGTVVRTTLTTDMAVRIEQLGEVGEGNSFIVPIRAVTTRSGAIATRGDDGTLRNAFQKALDDAARQIADYFSSKLTVKIKGPEKDFDPDDVTLILDGDSIQPNAQVRIVKGRYLQKPHTLKAELDGFQTVTIEAPFDSDTTRTITMKKTEAGKQGQPAQ